MFARDHLDKPQEDWEKVMWSHESKTKVFDKKHNFAWLERKHVRLYPKNTISIAMHKIETLCVGSALLQREQDN